MGSTPHHYPLYARHCTQILWGLDNARSLGGSYSNFPADNGRYLSSDTTDKWHREKQSNPLLVPMLQLSHHTEADWNKLAENHHQRF